MTQQATATPQANAISPENGIAAAHASPSTISAVLGLNIRRMMARPTRKMTAPMATIRTQNDSVNMAEKRT